MADKIHGFEPTLVQPHPERGGHQVLYRFPNGYGASVVPDRWFDSLREVAVIYWSPDVPLGWDFDWSTPVASYSERTAEDHVEEMLQKINNLPPREVGA